MASRIQGISIEIGGNTTGLNKALGDTNKQIDTTQKALKDVERLLKLDPTNTTLLEQKQRLLATSVGDTKAKLDSLKNAEKQVQEQFLQGKVSQQQYDNLQREIVATEQQLKNLETQAEKSNVVLSQIGTIASNVGAGASKIASATRGISLATGGALVGMAGMAVQAGKSADEINTLAKQTGLTTEQIQKFQYASDIIDVDLNTFTGSLAKLTKNMQSAKNGSKTTQEAFNELGISVVDDVGKLRSNDDVFNETIDALARVENETQRDALAFQIFGKSAQDLNPLILGGSDALKILSEEAEKAGLILPQDTLDKANEFNDSLDSLKATAAGTFAEVGTEIATMLIPFMENLSVKVKDVLEWVRGLDEGQLAFIGTILLLITAIAPVAGLISGISTVVGGLTAVITTVSGAIALYTGATTTASAASTFLAGSIALLTSPVFLVIAAIVAFVAIIALWGDQIQAILQKVDDFLQGVFATDWREIFGPVLGDRLNEFFKNFENIWNAIKRIFDGVIDFIRGVFTGDWERAWKGVQNIFGGIFDYMFAMVKVPINGIIGLLNSAVSCINALIIGLNSIGFTMPDWLGGGSFNFNIPTIPNIPYLAKGGIMSNGSAIVGEAGPELLTVLGNKTMVQPLTSQSKITNTSNTGKIVINVIGAEGQSEYALAERVAEKIENITQRKEAVYE